MAKGDDERTARLFFLGTLSGASLGCVLGWVTYDISGGLVGVFLGAMVAVIGIGVYLIARSKA